jgi:hypothetical protein
MIGKALNRGVVCVALVLSGAGCQNEAYVTGRLVEPEGSPLAQRSVILLPVCRTPNGITSFSTHEREQLVNPVTNTDDGGHFTLQVDTGWLREVCRTQPGCERYEREGEKIFNCWTLGFDLDVGGPTLSRLSSDHFKSGQAYFETISEPGITEELGTITVHPRSPLARNR